MADFLNKFDRSVRFRLSKINERVTALERSLQYCEAAIRQTTPDDDDDAEGNVNES